MPDVQRYKQSAYNRILRALRVLERENGQRDGVSTANNQGRWCWEKWVMGKRTCSCGW